MTSITLMKLQKTLSANPKAEAQEFTSYLAKLANGTTRELSELVIGRNFVWATLENGSSKVFVSQQSLVWLEAFPNQPALQLNRTHKTIAELTSLIRYPTTAHYWYLAKPEEAFCDRVQATLRGFLVLERKSILIPLASLGYLEVEL